MKKPIINVEFSDLRSEQKDNSRRKFLKKSGLLVAGTGLFMYSCSDENLEEDFQVADANGKGSGQGQVFNLGKGDLAILNYAYILEQLEAAFYANVVTDTGLSFSPVEDNEEQIFTELYYHEVIHREFFKKALNTVAPPGKVAPDLDFNFSSVDFTDRQQVLTVSQILEDTGVSAYNGAGTLLENLDYLLVAGKIVSVEARHASAIRNLIAPGTTNFASDDILVKLFGTGPAYDKATPPLEVLQAVKATGFLETKLITNNFPTA
ncbi:ferritin-like domain-containing protein [Christiangramia forsetii]|nr:ferritin-like domain-containing protein [Christiangramia forsetii]GGG39086.1 hypothetical protein GCM10011532_23600 [Christiangramia forsetii]